MSVKTELKKFVLKAPVIRDIFALIVGCINGILYAIENPEFDRTQFLKDMEVKGKNYE